MNAEMEDILTLISECRSKVDMDSKVSLFNAIRQIVSERTGKEIKIPSMLTDDLINSTLDRIKC